MILYLAYYTTTENPYERSREKMFPVFGVKPIKLATTVMTGLDNDRKALLACTLKHLSMYYSFDHVFKKYFIVFPMM